MNASSYKTVFSKRLGALVAVGEHATSQGKANGASGPGASGVGEGAVSALAGIGYVAALSASFAFVSIAWAAPATTALPTGGTVVHGTASMSQNASQLNITQGSQRAAINWQNFDIGANAKVNVVQPNAQAVLLNRVVGQSPSQIFGQLQANGHVILVNPNGVLFGKDGSVNAGGFTASTLNISDANFMAGNMVYERNGSTAGIVNQGKISTEPGGYVALLGATVSNEGSIHTQGGSVVMGAGETIKVPVSGTGRIKLELTPAAINASVSNSGSIVTEGGQVYMQALALNRAAAQILQSGSIDTTGEKGGDVHVLADGGHIRVDGSIKANSTNGTAGGDIYIGRDKDTNELAAVGDVSGATLESKGGFVETSGQYLKVDNISVKAKDWLLDPANIEIVPDTAPETGTTLPAAPQSGPVNYEATTASRVRAKTIADNLNNGTNVTLSTGVDANSTTGDEGNIVVNAAIEKTGDKSAKLTLIANNRIIVNRRIGKKSAPASGDTGDLDVDMTAHGNRKTEVQGSVVMNNVIDAGKGKVNITATSKTGWEGLIFQGTSGINAGTYTVKGSSLSTAVRFNGGTATFNSSSGDSLIEGNGAGFGGVFASSGNTINLNTTGTATTTLASGATSAGGMRFGFGGGVTVNTNGNVTIGSHSDNAHLLVQANVNVNGGTLTLKGKSAIEGILIQDAAGVSHSIKVNNGSNLVMDGQSTGSRAGITGVVAQHAIQMTGGAEGAKGSIKMSGTSTSGTGINTSNLTITSDGGEISLIGTGAGPGLHLGSIIKGGNINLEGTSTGSSQGVYASNAANIKSDTGVVTIKGTSNTGTATQLQGAVTGQTGVTIEGVTNGKPADSRSVLIENTITAETGNIAVTGKINNNTDAGQRAITLVGTASKLDAKNGNIELNADSLLINTGSATMVSAAGTDKGVVSINTTSPDKLVVLGGPDSNIQLGIDSGEMGKIAANKLVIGNASRTANINVTGATTTNSDLELQTQGSIAINQALTVGTSGDKNLTLNATGNNSQITQDANGIITAKQLNITGTSAGVALATAANQVNKLAANVRSLDFKNGKALQIGVGNAGITASGKIKVQTTTGNLTITKSVETTNADADAVVLNAGADKTFNNLTGLFEGSFDDNIVSDGGNVIVGEGGVARLYTGSTSANTASLAGGDGTGRYRYNSDESTTSFSKALEAGVNVIYREAPEVTVKVNDVNKVYDGVAHSGGSFSSTPTAVGLKNGDTDALVGSNAVFSGNAQGVKDVLASVGTTISALDNGKNALGYKVTYTDGKLSITPRPLTIAPGSVATKTADGTTAATVTPGALSNLVGTETLAVAATGTFSDANAGNNKAVNAFYTLQNGANGGLASNYVLALGKPGNPDTRMRANITSSINPTPNPTPFITPVNNNTVSRVRTVAGFGTSGAATGVLDDKAVTESREVCSDVFPENCECQPSVIPSIEICFAPKSVAATKEEK